MPTGASAPATPTCHAEAAVDLALDPQAAWDAVMDWNRQSEWMLFTRVRATGNDGRGVGGGVSARTSVGPLRFTDDMVITHWDPPHECTVKHLGTIVRGTGTFAIRPTPTPPDASATPPDGTTAPGATTAPNPPAAPPAPGGGTARSTGARSTGARSTFVWSEDVIPPLGRVGRAAWPVIRPAFQLMMRISLNRLAKAVAR